MPAFSAATSDVTKWSKATYVNEYITSLREREDLLDQSHMPLTGIGTGYAVAYDDDDVQNHELWSDIQGWVRLNYHLFMDEGGSGIQDSTETEPWSFRYPDDDGDPDEIKHFYEEAGLDYDHTHDQWGGFRRKQNMDDDFSYGLVQAGDIIGYWVFEDLQLAFRALLKVFRQGEWNKGSDATDNAKGDDWGTYDANWSTALSNGQSAFSSSSTWDEAGASPTKFAEAEHYSPDNEYGVCYRAIMNKARVTLNSDLFAKVASLDYYVLAGVEGFPTPATYDDNGDDVHANSLTWNEFDSVISVSSSPVYSDWLGDLSNPTGPPQPASGSFEYQGYSVEDTALGADNGTPWVMIEINYTYT